MKLVYLWVETYQFIKNQGYLLNSGYEVRFDDKERFWEINKKENLDRLLYGNDISVTAIVGDNGAGKSTLLDIIRLMLFDERNRKKISGFLVWEDEGNLGMLHLMKERPYVRFEGAVVRDTSLPQDFNLIYYSDFLDLKYYLEDFDDGEDVYTDIEEIEDGFSNRDAIQINVSTAHLIKHFNNKIMDYFHSDIKKQITYYGDLKQKKLPFSMPQNLSVKIEFLDIERFDKVLDAPLDAYEYGGMGHHGEINTNAHVIDLLKSLQRIYKKKIIRNAEPINERQLLQWNIFVTFIYNLLSDRKENRKEVHDYEQVDYILKRMIWIKISESNIWKELNRIFEHAGSVNEYFEIYYKFYDIMMYRIDTPKKGNFYVEFSLPDTLIEPLMDNNLWSYVQLDNNYVHNYLDNAMINFPKAYMDANGWNGNWIFGEFMQVYDIYTKISYEIDFLKFSWGLSTGESNMFNLFARLYDGMKYKPKQKVLLIFDELDSSFHPQWQQEIMMELTSYLRSVYPQTEFQILLTTHSPVLLSDVPRENVLFIKKDRSSEEEHEQTFAANIASLYYDSFFMKKGSVGEVAKNTIGNLLSAISVLDNKEHMHNKEVRLLSSFLQKQFSHVHERDIEKLEYGGDAIQRLIDSIGEEIWRYKINEKYHQFLKSEDDILEREIWKDLKILEQKKGKKYVQKLFNNWFVEDEK